MPRPLTTLTFALLCLPGLVAAQVSDPAPRGPVAASGRGAGSPVEPVTIRLWEQRAPGALGTDEADVPTLTYYAPQGRGAGTAVVVAPGGGYGALAMNHEGRQIANWLNAQGVAAFVLRYRLGPTYRHPVEIGDAQRAIRLVRSRAAELNVLPDRVGMMGFSAGGHLTSTAGTHFDAGDPASADPIERVSSRPDFLVLAYPVITSSGPYVHAGSMRNLLGESPPAALLDLLSNDRQVTKDTPPAFLFHTNADAAVPAENSVLFYLALRRAGVPAELHVFEPGPHGVGLAMSDPTLAGWPPLLSQWLRQHGWLTRP
ncbi:MAG: alpha/beta hydrolase [Acidobacteria bacterium]|nr:alpha/beta hydrolase [Acidobacteriota bacterium]